jgi:hypothetical protein
MSADGSNKGHTPRKWHHYVLRADGKRYSGKRGHALWATWIAIGCLSVTGLLDRQDHLFRRSWAGIWADIPLDPYFLAFCYITVIAIIAIPMRWGFTIPSILFGFFVASKLFGPMDYRHPDSILAASYFWAFFFGVFGFVIDCCDSSEPTSSDPPTDRPTG